MENSFWQLPGPQTFLRKIIADLQSFRHVVTVMPDIIDRRLLRKMVKKGEKLYVRSLKIDPKNDDPFVFFARKLDCNDFELHKAADIHAKMSKEGGVFSLEGLQKCSKDLFAKYIKIIDELGKLSRQEDVEYCIFVIIAPGDPCPRSDVSLEIRNWWGCLGSSDLLIRIEQCINTIGELTSAQHYWVRSLCYGFARTDLSLVPLFIESIPKKPTEIIDILEQTELPFTEFRDHPDTFLRSKPFFIRGENNPSPPKRKPELTLWKKGMLDFTPDTGVLLHPAVQADKIGTVQARLTQGQFVVIYPLVERVRQCVVLWLKQELGENWYRYSHEKNKKIVKEKCSEIGKLQFYIFNYQSSEKVKNHKHYGEVSQLVTEWKLIRNKLAHGDNIPFESFESAIRRFKQFLNDILR